jgi:hypothetical protein
MKKVLRATFWALLAMGSCVQAQTGDVVRIVNRLRAPGGACATSAPPVVPQGALDAAASELARGASLDAALKSAGYRMTEVRVITVAGEGLHPQLEALLASRFCAQIGIHELSDAGVHDSGSQIWIVLAAPFAPRVNLTRQQGVERMLALVNAARAEARYCGDKSFGIARPVKWNERLESAAD